MSINYTMIRVAQHVETYFLTKYPNVAVFEISAKLKVGKEITISTAKEIMKSGNDNKGLDIIDKLENPIKEKGKRKPKKEKLDDLCDTVCQIDAFVKELERLGNKFQKGYILKTKSASQKKKQGKEKNPIEQKKPPKTKK